ncbi:GH24994 [Drosophila grimshawi]|uniref:GH24994 n=1 Tax=Drosophila grimshawi TaxID=7222 RepID=B4K340_DROGR|nr:GH24994 [Drosophila grimshawi]
MSHNKRRVRTIEYLTQISAATAAAAISLPAHGLEENGDGEPTPDSASVSVPVLPPIPPNRLRREQNVDEDLASAYA